MVMLTALPVTAILGVSLRILVAVCKTAVPDFSHLEGISDENNQLVSTAQKSFASAKLALFSQVRLVYLEAIDVSGNPGSSKYGPALVSHRFRCSLPLHIAI